MRHVSKLGLAFLIAAPGAASAADLPARVAPPPVFAAAPVATWEGFYAGAFIGGAWTRFETSPALSHTARATSATTGVLAGYNVQSGAYVFGLEGDISENFAKASTPAATGLVANTAESLHSVHLRGRLGYDLGAFLPFVAGGLTYNESAVSVPVVGGGFRGDNRTSLGWNLGAGVDWRVPLPIIGETILRAEYLYDRIPSRTYSYDPALPGVDMKSGAHQIRAALIYTPTLRGWRAPQVDVADWSGAYAGALAGYSSAKLQTTTSAASQSLTADGGLGGLYAGRNFVFGNFVVGWEGATMLSSLRGDGLVPGSNHALSTRSYFESDIRGRVGYAFGRFLPFVAGGAAFIRSEQTDRDTLSHRSKVNTNAWTLGGGLDYMLMDRLSARVEYLYQKSWNDADVDLNGVPMKQSRSANVVRAGLAWHFH